MGYVNVELTAEIIRALQEQWGIVPGGGAARLFGGEESAAFRIGEYAVRIGPPWRSDQELAWSYSIAAAVAVDVPEVTAPVRCRGGAYLIRIGGRPVSVWPYVAGVWADPGDERQRAQAAGLLARLHRAFAAMRVDSARPAGVGPGRVDEPLLQDPALDRWMVDFHARRCRRQLLHGDFYRGNVLVRDGAVVGLLDWDDVFLGPPEQELAWAAWEWCKKERQMPDMAVVSDFIAQYRSAGGTAEPISEREFAQLVRDRIRNEVTYSQAGGVWGTSTDPEDLAYEAGQLRAFHILGQSQTYPAGRVMRRCSRRRNAP